MVEQKFTFKLEVTFRSATKEELVSDRQLLSAEKFAEYDAEQDMRDELSEAIVKRALRSWINGEDIGSISEDMLYEAPTNWSPLKSIRIR